MARPRIGGIGDLLVEIVATDKNRRHLEAGPYVGPFPSGSPGIFIDQAAHLGAHCIFVGAVGDDAFGQVILNRLAADGVDASLIATVKGVPTGTAFVSYNGDGSRDFVFNIAHSAAARFGGGPAEIDALASFGLDDFHVSGSSLGNAEMCAKILGVCRALHGAGVKISFDPNVRKELMGNSSYFSAVKELMGLCSIFLPSEDDAAMLFPGQPLARFAPPLLAAHMDFVVLKKGEHGCEAMDKSGALIALAAHKVTAVDPTGAGDCFCATFVTLIAGGSHDFRGALERANAAGALAVSKLGPMEGSSSLEQIYRWTGGPWPPSSSGAEKEEGQGPPVHLRRIIAANRAGKRRGIASWCTAHRDTLYAILRAHRGVAGPILVEATCNQVNHQGGYTGMTPAVFRGFVEGLAAETGINASRIVLGGDHLGPNPWKHLPAAQAMAEAKTMVAAYVAAGFRKIHLDASMACADDGALGEPRMAERAAELCAAAEAAAAQPLAYVIGTEVPVPGGETEALDTLAVTRPDAARRTYELHRAAFEHLGIGAAFTRIIAIVVQPGVDFGNVQVFSFDAPKAAGLSATIAGIPAAVFEAHSTDYQSPKSLASLVAGHFAILKVGPELTFAFREAVFAMAAIEDHLPAAARSNIVGVIDEVMNADNRHWRGYVQSGAEERTLRLFGLSDRVRYYWPDPRIARAVEALRANIDQAAVPPGLLAQYAGAAVPEDAGLPLSARIIDGKVGAVVDKYLGACASQRSGG